MPEKPENKIDYKFVSGLLLMVFLVLTHVLIGEIPIFLVLIPAVIMGADFRAILDFVREWRK